MFQLVKINKESGASSQKQETQQNDQPKHTDLSVYVISYTWSGDVEQAGRKLNSISPIPQKRQRLQCRPGTEG